ncbi:MULTISPECIES: hypothetical protein [Gordonia]|uniref:hypothetical protein n=1 Tax=Gordonia TaxID=2053 RepID=UPI0019BD4982|nr:MULTISPECIES: hypothetical protein [Gordonia]MBD0022349.1 hypothetical protein [Gordonia sp. (in: high G+C Gram-positive bacteria)]
MTTPTEEGAEVTDDADTNDQTPAAKAESEAVEAGTPTAAESAAEPATAEKPETGDAEKKPEPASGTAASSGPAQSDRRVSISVRSLVVGAALLVLAATTITFALLWAGARSDISERDDRAADNRRAEQIALDYAVGAATTDYQKLDDWFARLKKGTTPELAAKFDATAPSLKQILAPLGWKSTAQPITSVTKSSDGGIFKVDAFVNVSSTSSQAPNGATTTVTYSITIDSNKDWQITDVGGLQGIVPQ